MSYHEGSNWQARKEDEAKALYDKKQQKKLIMPQDQVSDALKECGGIMAVCYELTGASGKSSLIVEVNQKQYKITFESL